MAPSQFRFLASARECPRECLYRMVLSLLAFYTQHPSRLASGRTEPSGANVVRWDMRSRSISRTHAGGSVKRMRSVVLARGRPDKTDYDGRAPASNRIRRSS
jgi:hypothetical protein